jgi:hypothetical protein
MLQPWQHGFVSSFLVKTNQKTAGSMLAVGETAESKTIESQTLIEKGDN